MKSYSSLRPSSPEAVVAGCTCIGNDIIEWDGEVFYWVDNQCPLHGEDTHIGESDES